MEDANLSPRKTVKMVENLENGPAIERRASRASRASRQEEQDEEVLAEFGYKQELNRDWGLMHNFGISFSIIVRFPPSISTLLL